MPAKEMADHLLKRDKDKTCVVYDWNSGSILGKQVLFIILKSGLKVYELAVGDELLIRFDCTQATESLPTWAAENHYPVTRFEQVGPASWEIVVQKI